MISGQSSEHPPDTVSHIAHRLHGGVIWSASTPGLEVSFVSDSAIELLGFPARLWQAERDFLKKHSHPQDWSHLLESVFDAMVEGGVHTVRHRMFTADGSLRWAQTAICRAGADAGFDALTVDITDVKTAEEQSREAEIHTRQRLAVTNRELTERRKNEQSLAESEAQLRLMVDSVKDYGLFMISSEGEVQTWNRGAQRLEGYQVREALGAPISRFFPSDENEKQTPARLLETARMKGVARYEGWLVRKQGSQFWGALTLSLIEDKAGLGRGFSIVMRDVTVRKHNEDALRESELRLRLLIDSLTDHCVVMLSPEGRVSSWSPGAERLKGYRAEEIIGQRVSRFFTSEEIARGTVDGLLERAAAEGRSEYEGWAVRKGGSTFWETATLSAVRDASGELRGFSIVARDMTDRMQTERAQTFLSTVGVILATSLDYHVTLDRIMHLATRNLAQWCAVALIETPTEPIVVAHVDPEKERVLALAMRTEHCQSRLLEGIATVLQTGEPELRTDASAMGCLTQSLGLEDPGILDSLSSQSYLCVPLTARGKMLGAMLFVSTPRARYGRDELMLAQELGRRTALGVDHARLYEQAQAAIHVRDQVLAVVSHDLLNPVNTVQLLATQLSSHLKDGENSAKTRQVAERIHAATHRMTRMIRDLLDYSKIEAGKLSVDIAVLNVAVLIGEVIEVLQPMAISKGAQLRQEAEASNVDVRCDHDRMLQVFSNLVGNAVKFGGKGTEVVVRARAERDQVIFSVSDNGPGIPEVDVPHIFDRYWQGERSPQGSLGLGLATAKAFIETQKGAMWAESTVGTGTTIFFTLPIG